MPLPWLSFSQIKTAIREREKAMEMKNRLLRILDDRDVFLEQLADSRKKAFEVEYVVYREIAIKVILVPFKSVDSICFKTFYRFLISILIYKISRLV